MSEQPLSMQLMFICILWIISSIKCTVGRSPPFILKWNKHIQDFEHITGLPTLEDERKKNSLAERFNHTYNFGGNPLYLTYHEVN